MPVNYNRPYDAFARPALHVLMTLGFAAAFLWPIFAFTRPIQTFHFSYVVWLLSLATLLRVSRSDDAGASDPDTQHSAPPSAPASQERS